MLFLNILLLTLVPFSDTVNVSKEHLLQEVTVVANRTMNKGNKIIVQMREDENKTMDEVLASVPHVAVTERGISIDGRGKVKVLFNGHEVRMEGAALVSYLQGLRSSDISKVEVQTVPDASQDANVQGGVINIVLRKKKDNGMSGSIDNRLNAANTFFRNTAAASVFSRWNKINLYASFSNPITAKNDGEGRIKRVFNVPLYDYNSASSNRIPARDYYWRIGGFADLSTRWNVGAEYAFTLNRLKRTTNDRTSIHTPDINMHDVLSTYTQKLRNHLHSLQADVSYKVDNEGSRVKFSTSYDVRRLRGDNVNLFENRCDSSKIARPLFSQQNPTKTQTSLFTYTMGNVALRPEYVNSIRSTFVYNYIYSLTLGIDMHSDLIREFSLETTDNPLGSYVTFINHHQENHWYAYLSLPFQPCHWFNISLNTLLCYQTI